MTAGAMSTRRRYNVTFVAPGGYNAIAGAAADLVVELRPDGFAVVLKDRTGPAGATVADEWVLARAQAELGVPAARVAGGVEMKLVAARAVLGAIAATSTDATAVAAAAQALVTTAVGPYPNCEAPAGRSAFVVVGECGEYSDARTWVVAAYEDKEEAESAAARLTTAAAEHVAWRCDKCGKPPWQHYDAETRGASPAGRTQLNQCAVDPPVFEDENAALYGDEGAAYLAVEVPLCRGGAVPRERDAEPLDVAALAETAREVERLPER